MVSSISSTSASGWSEIQRILYNSDTNGDGTVSKTELTTALTSNSDAATQLVSEADSDGDGAVSLSEFSTFSDMFSTATGLALISAQDVSSSQAAVFTSMDTDGDGLVTASEMTDSLTAASSDTSSSETTTETTTTSSSDDDTDSSDIAYTDATGTAYTKEEIASIIDSVDANGDGKFDKNDVAAMLVDAVSNSDDTDDTTSSTSVLSSVYGVSSSSDDEDEI